MKILLTAITPGIGGAGDYLAEIKNTYDGLVISPIKLFTKNNFFQKIISQLGVFFIKMIGFSLPFFYKGHLTIYHHQTIGYSLTKRLLASMNKVDFYILDASFFCMKSYNFLNEKACLNCLKTFNPDISCKSFPKFALTSSILSFRKQLHNSIDKILFIVQTESHKLLLNDSFLKKPIVEVRKMTHPKLNFEVSNLKKDTKYDFAFHGNNLEAKGSKYVFNLSKKMKNQTFIFPFRLNNLPKNCFCEQKNWDNGLADILTNSKVILCPSLWSAPVESSILKTMLLNKPVAIVKSDYSASNDIYPENTFIHLSGDMGSDIDILKRHLNSPKKLKEISGNAYLWAKKYIDEE